MKKNKINQNQPRKYSSKYGAKNQNSSNIKGANMADTIGKQQNRSAKNGVIIVNSSRRTQSQSAKKGKSTTNSSQHCTDNKWKQFLLGKCLVGAELISSIVLFAYLWKLRIFPLKHMILIAGVVVFVFAVFFAMQLGNKTVKIIGAVLTLMIILVISYGGYQLYKLDLAINDVGGATYKIDNMIVAVCKDDPAQNISDAKDYKFGYQTFLDKVNTETMIAEVKATIGEDITLVSYENAEALGKALLEKKIDAAIYNGAFNKMIEDTIEDYESEIRILYQHGIKTELEVEDKSIRKPFSVYISGIDVYGSISTSSRSDVNIIMTVNPNTKKILLTSTPRDYFVPIPGVSNGVKDKLTHAGMYGVDKSMATLEELYNTDITYYLRINFTSLVKIIDVIGGVDVNSEYSFSTRAGYKFHKGINRLDGKSALAFSRERKIFITGDNQRGKNQQAVITAILQKVMSPEMLKNAGAILDKISNCIETNMSRDDITKLIRMQLDDGASWNIESINAVGTDDSQACYSMGSKLVYVMQPNTKSVADISAKIKSVLSE